MKEKSINQILNDFFEEILKELEGMISDYRKSNDEKFLTSIKDILENALDDTQLKNLASKDKDTFNKQMWDLYEEKKDREYKYWVRIKIVILKKIFFKLLIFSWRSHLQYFGTIKTSNRIKTIWSKRSFFI